MLQAACDEISTGPQSVAGAHQKTLSPFFCRFHGPDSIHTLPGIPCPRMRTSLFTLPRCA